jgi:AraC-like DNA-binding protein
VETQVPVRVGRNTIAVMLTGGVRLQPANADTFAPVAKALLDDDRSAAEIRSAKVQFEHVPVMQPERYEAALAILQSFAQQLGESAHRLLFATATHEPEAVRNAKSFIHEHLAEPMSLEAVASAVNVSPFHFCKLFKRATGLTFTDFVNRARVEKAKRMLMKPAARITEVAYDVGTAGILPTPWRQFATRMIDPVMRRTRPLEATGYTASPIDAIRASTPFLSREVPSVGTRTRAAFAPFSAESWFRKESQTVMRSDLPAEQKQATVDSLRQQAAKMNMSPQQQAEFMRLAGLPVDKFNMSGTSSVAAAANLQRLRNMGIGTESYGIVETTDKLNRTSTQLVAPQASSIGYQPRGLQALRFFGGVNLMAVPRGRPELAR